MHDAQKPETTAATDFQRPNLVFQLKTRVGVQDGINLIVDAIRPTLGPLPRTVAPTRNGFAKPFPQTILRLSSPPLHQHPASPSTNCSLRKTSVHSYMPNRVVSSILRTVTSQGGCAASIPAPGEEVVTITRVKHLIT